MTGLTLRPYQEEAINKTWQHLAMTDGNCIGVLPTGTGKSLVLAEFIRRAITEYPDTRILVLQHIRELIQQNVAELLRHWPEADVGIFSAGMNRKDKNAAVTFASIQSIYKKAFLFQEPPFDLVLVDEAHLIPRASNTTYRKFLADLQQINPHVRTVGFTATAFRTDSGMLHKGEDAIFSSIAYEYNIRDAIKDGYLCPPVSVASTVQIDTSGVGMRGGEFIPNQLQAVATDPGTVNAIADEMVLHGQDRKGWLFFGCGVEHATMMRDALRERGVTCECIFGDTPTAERDRIIAAYKRQEIRCLSAMNVLLIGFNAPHADMLAMGRPTGSCGLWIQAVGRVLRLHPGKTDGLVLCFGNNLVRHGPVDQPFIRGEKKKAGPGDAPVKACPECQASVPIQARECPDCGHEFPAPETRIDTRAATGALLSTQLAPQWLDVTNVTYRLHTKPDKPVSLCVTYHCGLAPHKEWVCLEHTGYAREKAVRWWQTRAPGTAAPMTVAEALTLTGALARPSQIQARASGKFTEITGVRF